MPMFPLASVMVTSMPACLGKHKRENVYVACGVAFMATVMRNVLLLPSAVAVMFVVPLARAVTSPPLDTEATSGLLVAHVAEAVTSCVLSFEF